MMSSLKWCSILVAALALAACDSGQDNRTPGQKLDQALASANQAASQAKQSAEQGLQHAAQATQQASQEVAKQVNDATITTQVKVGLAKDPQLNALRIEVDTKDGRVSLRGEAPNEAAKQRAERIAMNEKGVTGVDNQLAVENK